MMNKNDLEDILLVYEFNSFSKAADALNVTQPALSFKVKKIEKELGYKIFNRTNDITLTVEGELFFEYIKDIRLLDLNLRNKIDDLTNKVSGSLTIASANGFTTGFLPAYVSMYKKKYPDIKIRLIDDDIPSIERMCDEGKVDIFITATDYENKNIIKEKLYEEDLFICVPPRYKEKKELKDKIITKDLLLKSQIGCNNEYPVISLKEFKNETFIVVDDNLNIGEMFNSLLRDNEMEDVDIISTNQMTVGMMMTKYDLGISLVTENYVRYMEFSEFPIILKVDKGISSRFVYVAYSKKRYLSKASKAFLEMIKKETSNGINS